MPETFQERYHRRWHCLNDPHVRALAWLLDSPDLLDPAAPQWQGRVASLPCHCGTAGSDMAWLELLDREPAALHAFLDVQPFSRLGRYAEKLLAFYFSHRQILVAHGVQVRGSRNETIGELDFLLRTDSGLVHWEFATKFYLLQPAADVPKPEYFVGPNLADTLGAKMHKIFDRQLSLSMHPAAQPYLPQAVSAAQALVKGWLFYRHGEAVRNGALGVSENHCRGFWCDAAEADSLEAEYFTVLPRICWMAPARTEPGQALDRSGLKAFLEEHFRADSMPVLVALLAVREGWAVEVDRGFVVPADWKQRAAAQAGISLAGAG